LKGGKSIHLEPKVFTTLRVLVENYGRVVRKDELMKAGWPNTYVTDASLNRNVSKVREALEDQKEQPRYIINVPTIGYKFGVRVDYVDPETLHSLSIADESSTPPPSLLSTQGRLHDKDQRVLKAFEDGSRRLRSPNRIAQDTGLPINEVENLLPQLRARELVELARVWSGHLRWYITDKGRKVQAAADDNPAE
jgi:DNA-binding winged helix-turn-helix (wHTH) protein